MTISSDAYSEGFDANEAGLDEFANPYNWQDGHEMPPDEYFQWRNGWLAAEYSWL